MLEILKPGFLTTVQDQGRLGYQSYGVGVAGALDPFALAAANLLVGNEEGAAGLEMTLLGPALRFHAETLIAVTGADLRPLLDGRPVPSWTCLRVPSESTLTFAGAKSGVRAYLAVAGGIDLPPVMGSRSTYLLGRFGGLEGRPLRAKDRLPAASPPANANQRVGTALPEALRPPYAKSPGLRVIRGPFDDYFAPEGMQTFLSTAYTISPNSNRMGYRLSGEPIPRQKAGELITCGLANGTIQVPPDGQPIVLLADRQTIGGYPIIGVLISADLPLIAQCGPGDQLRFAAVSLEDARHAYLRLWSNLRNFFQAGGDKAGPRKSA